MAGLSEKYSENKRHKGRPRCFPKEFEALWTGLGIGIDYGTRRGKLNRYYALTAMSALKDEPGLDWLYRWNEMQVGTGKVRWTILSELGRVRDPDTMRDMAREVCEQKPKAAVAVSMIRELRVGRVVPGSAAGLKAALHRTLDAWQMTHPEIRYDLMRDVLKGLWEEMKLEAVRAPGPSFVSYLSGASGSKKAAKRNG